MIRIMQHLRTQSLIGDPLNNLNISLMHDGYDYLGYRGDALL